MTNKKVVIALIVLLVALTFEVITNIFHIMGYGKEKEAGNVRWEQVEEKFVIIENRIDNIENEIK